MVSKGQFVGLDWNRITRLHSQVMIGTQEVKNSLTASRCHLKAYQRCGQPTSKVSILKMKQQQHDINLRRTRKKNPSPRWDSDFFFPSPPQINIMLLLFHLQYTHFGGWLAASLICFKVTARCC